MERNENSEFNREPESFGVPEDYFQKSARIITNKIEWQEEHKDFMKLRELKNVNGFIVPGDYFSKNGKKIELIQYPTLSFVPFANPFGVPENYFEKTEITGLTKVILDQNDELSQFSKLKSIKRENGFKTNENYFSENEGRLVESLRSNRTKIIPLFSKRVAYTAAALLVVVLGMWIYHFYFTPLSVEDCGTIACIDKKDLVKAKNLESLDDDELYELVDPSMLERKLENTGSAPNDDKNKDSSLKNISAEELLDNI